VEEGKKEEGHEGRHLPLPLSPSPASPPLSLPLSFALTCLSLTRSHLPLPSLLSLPPPLPPSLSHLPQRQLLGRELPLDWLSQQGLGALLHPCTIDRERARVQGSRASGLHTCLGRPRHRASAHPKPRAAMPSLPLPPVPCSLSHSSLSFPPAWRWSWRRPAQVGTRSTRRPYHPASAWTPCGRSLRAWQRAESKREARGQGSGFRVQGYGAAWRGWGNG
jgi:hypothetical protein